MLILRYCKGVTLIEMMIALVVLGLLITLALPSYSTWIQNTQIRNAIESLSNGLRLARTEAVRRNVAVQMVIGPGASWTVSFGAPPATTIQSYSGEGAALASVSRFSGTPPVADATATTITFNGLGRVVANMDGSASVTQIDVDSASNPGDARELRVAIDPASGNVRSCDPQVSASDDPRYCLNP